MPIDEQHYWHKIRLAFASTGTKIHFTLAMNIGSKFTKLFFSGSLKCFCLIIFDVTQSYPDIQEYDGRIV